MSGTSLGGTKRMDEATVSLRLYLVAGVLALMCIPLILLAERHGASQAPINVIQLIAVPVCMASSATYLFATRGRPFGWQRSLGVVALTLTGLWLAFICFVILTFDLSAMD